MFRFFSFSNSLYILVEVLGFWGPHLLTLALISWVIRVLAKVVGILVTVKETSLLHCISRRGFQGWARAATWESMYLAPVHSALGKVLPQALFTSFTRLCWNWFPEPHLPTSCTSIFMLLGQTWSQCSPRWSCWLCLWQHLFHWRGQIMVPEKQSSL